MSLDEQENFFYGVIMFALRKEGQIVVCGNPVDLKDVLWLCENNPAFHHFKFPILDKNNQPLWPERRGWDYINRKRAVTPAYLFARECMLERVNPENAPFKKKWIKYYETAPASLYRVMTVDPSITEEGDPMGIVVSGTDKNNDTYVLERGSYHGTIEQNIDKIFEIYLKWEPEVFGIETFVFQKMYKHWLEREMSKRNCFFGIVELERSEGMRKSKTMRILALQPKIEHGGVKFHRDQKPIVDQLLNFNPSSKHNVDDEIESLAYQVPLWQIPNTETKPISKEGTFQEALERLENVPPANYLEGLFRDMGPEDESGYADVVWL